MGAPRAAVVAAIPPDHRLAEALTACGWTWDGVAPGEADAVLVCGAPERVGDVRAATPHAPVIAVGSGLTDAAVRQCWAAGAWDVLDLAVADAASLAWMLRRALERWTLREATLSDAPDLDRLFAESPIGMALVDLDGRWLRVNAALLSLLDCDEATLLQRRFQDITHPDDLEADLANVGRLLTGEIDSYSMEKRYFTPGGDIVWVLLSVAMAHDAQGGALHFVAQIVDITERKAMEQRLRVRADEDPLTGLWTRRRFEQELEREVARCRRFGGTAALFIIDLDHFKEVNDTFGHKVGDDLLLAVAQIMRDRLRAVDAVARLGGDEFGVLLPGTRADDAAEVAQDLKAAIAGRQAVSAGQTVVTTASVGVGFIDETTESGKDAMVAADLAMYDAKAAGRHLPYGAAAGATRRERTGTTLAMAQRLRRALTQGEGLLLHAQPVMDLGRGGVALYEMLVRLRDDDGEPIAPARFLPVAERVGLLPALDRWVVERALDDQATWASRGHDLTLSVNLSGRSVSDPHFPSFVEDTIAATGADPGSLVFELTETEAIANMRQARALVDHLGALGCRTALDDFGAGFASFAYLKHLPVDMLKIDSEFIRDLDTSAESRILVDALLMVSRAMGHVTVAEWVTSASVESAVRELGIDLAQGFGLGFPTPLAELLEHGPQAALEPLARPQRPIRILHCDDSEPYRALVRAMLSTCEGVALVGEASGHEETLRVAARLRPDVVLLDAMVDDRREDIAEELHRVAPNCRVLVLSGGTSDDLPLPGHDAWLRKTVTADELERSLRAPAPI